jgi:oligosaccharide repeat unit polymerase
MVGIAFIGCIFSSSRAEILLLIAALTCVHLMKTNRLSFIAAIRFIRWPLLLFTFLWIALIFTNKNTDAFGSSVGGIILIFLVNYIVGPVVALDYVLRHPTEYVGLPNHTFKFFLSIASSFHLIPYTPPPGFDAFVSVPFPTNVYTVYKYFVTDFGLFGALGVMMLIGFLHTLLYRKARTGSELAIYWFALTMFPVIMVIFDEQYAAFGSYIDMLLVGILCIFLRSEPMLRLPRIQRRIIS